MKKFKFCIVDDQGPTAQGFTRILNLLKRHNYLIDYGNYNSIQISDNQDMESGFGWNEEKQQSMDFRVFSSKLKIRPIVRSENLVSQKNGFTFCEAFETFFNEVDVYDFYVFDINFDVGAMDPTSSENQCKEALKYSAKSAPQKTEAGRYSFLEPLLKISRLQSRPIFVYSAAPETQQIRSFIDSSAFYKSVCIMEIESGSYSLDADNPFFQLDSYLRNKQKKLLHYQSPDFLEELIERVENDLDWDKPDIPDCDENDHWSLKTLFPRQINSIEACNAVLNRKMPHYGRLLSKIEEHKKEISIICQADWRTLCGKLFNHPLSPNTENNKIDIVKDLVNSLDFKIESGPKKIEEKYSRLTDLPVYEKNELNKLRLFTIKNVQFIGRDNVIQYFSEIEDRDNWLPCWEDYARNFGIYPIDIAYLNHIAQLNSNHFENISCPEVTIQKTKNASVLEMKWLYPSLPDNENIFDENGKLFKKMNADRTGVLKDEGISDFCNIVCWRYKGTFQFQSGGKSLIVDGNKGVKAMDTKSKNSETFYRVTIEKP